MIDYWYRCIFIRCMSSIQFFYIIDKGCEHVNGKPIIVTCFVKRRLMNLLQKCNDNCSQKVNGKT